MAKFAESAARVCYELLGEPPSRIEFPGGRSRKAVRLQLAQSSVIVTKRDSAERAALEANVLYALYRQGAPVPRVLALDGKWTIQEDLGGRRLPSILDNADTAQIEVALGAAMESLARIHEAGSRTGLERFVVTIGDQPEWLLELIDTPRRLGKYFALPAPKLAETALVDQLRVVVPRLIKWDARPGNAMVRANGTVAWFDWEHCACRNRLDDLAWLLGDEYVPDLPDVEERLLDVHLSAFTDDGDADKARQYLAAFGTFHMCVRLALIVTKKGTGPWWDWQYCVAGDKVGVSLEAARRTCLRASRWAAKTELTDPLAPWLRELAIKISEDQRVEHA